MSDPDKFVPAGTLFDQRSGTPVTVTRDYGHGIFPQMDLDLDGVRQLAGILPALEMDILAWHAREKAEEADYGDYEGGAPAPDCDADAAPLSLEAAEELTLATARAQVARGDNPGINTTAMLIATVERLTGQASAAGNGNAANTARGEER